MHGPWSARGHLPIDLGRRHLRGLRGNAASSASGFVPATYDEVITVSAIADFDGQPGGTGTPTCQIGYDDTFVNFSNFAQTLTRPVRAMSTWRGGGYRSISGTSMASPHVTGAAALFLLHPHRRDAGMCARRTREAGTLDWVGDPDNSAALLDVGPLTTPQLPQPPHGSVDNRRLSHSALGVSGGSSSPHRRT